MASQSDSRERSDTREPVKPWLCRLPASLDKKLAKRAFDENRPKAELVRDAVAAYLGEK